jgi:hypothetical protein
MTLSFQMVMPDTHTPETLAFNTWAKELGWPAVCDPDLNFEAEILHQLLVIWRALAGTNALPHRAKLTPRVLKPFLKHIIILERTSEYPLRARVRLQGTHLVEVLGEMQGKYLDEALTADVVPHWHSRLGLALSENRPLRFVSRVDVQKKSFLRSETLWAPLAGDDGAPPQVLVSAIMTFNDAKAAVEQGS